MYRNSDYRPYTFEAVKTSKQGYMLSTMYEQELITVMLYRQSTLESALDSIDLDLIFEPVSKYTKEEIEITMMSTRDVRNVELFWDIFVRVAMKSVGVHVEWEMEEEERPAKKKKSGKKKTVSPESLEVGESFELELPPEVSQEINEMLMEEEIV